MRKPARCATAFAARTWPDLLGKDIQEARRQLEGLEFLFECELMRRRYEP